MADVSDYAEINALVSNRHGPKVITIDPALNPYYCCGPEYQSPKLMTVFADRHNRIWRYDPQARELRMIIDPEAARF